MRRRDAIYGVRLLQTACFGRHIWRPYDGYNVLLSFGQTVILSHYSFGEERLVWKFIVRRTALALVIILLGAFIIYGVMRCLPTSFVESMARQRSFSAVCLR